MRCDVSQILCNANGQWVLEMTLLFYFLFCSLEFSNQRHRFDTFILYYILYCVYIVIVIQRQCRFVGCIYLKTYIGNFTIIIIKKARTYIYIYIWIIMKYRKVLHVNWILLRHMKIQGTEKLQLVFGLNFKVNFYCLVEFSSRFQVFIKFHALLQSTFCVP